MDIPVSHDRNKSRFLAARSRDIARALFFAAAALPGCMALGIDDCARACLACHGRMGNYHMEDRTVGCACEYPSSLPPGAVVLRAVDRGDAVDVWFKSNGLPFHVTLSPKDWQATTRRSDLTFRTDEKGP